MESSLGILSKNMFCGETGLHYTLMFDVYGATFCIILHGLLICHVTIMYVFRMRPQTNR